MACIEVKNKTWNRV